jgi:TPR repeat protein
VFACVGCGKEYPAGTKFCAECGGKIKAKSSLQSEKNYKAGEDKEKQGEYRSAIDWYEKADSYRAWCRIGHIYQKGFGNVPVNMEVALNAYRKAAAMKDENQKDGFAECYLGYFYKSGNCVSRNIVEARKWFKISAAFGNEYAKKELKRLGC